MADATNSNDRALAIELLRVIAEHGDPRQNMAVVLAHYPKCLSAVRSVDGT